MYFYFILYATHWFKTLRERESVCVCACARARVFFSYEPKDKERVFPYAIFDWSLYFEKR